MNVEFKHHMQTYNCDQTLACKDCWEGLLITAELKRHMEKCMVNKRYKWKKCGAGFSVPVAFHDNA